MIIYNKFDEFYKCPQGAVSEETKVCFKINLPFKYNDYPVVMIVMHNSSKKINIIDMKIETSTGGVTTWKCTFVPNEIGVYWYNFKINTEYEDKEYVIPNGKEALITNFLNQMNPMEKKYWRFTVYTSEFEVPDWIKGGVVYQIFPDRFYRGSIESKVRQKKSEKQRLHDKWDDFPCWSCIEEFMGSSKDFYGGNLKGITEKIDYLVKLGINCIYLNPIFESNSSHRYNTGNYEVVDGMLGSNDDFKELCEVAKKNGIRIINDGVFSHTGSDSKYFNIYNSYDTVGAYNSEEDSEYSTWYKFYEWPDYYWNWWNFDTLPKLQLNNQSCCNYFLGENGIVEQWCGLGNSGWRLDAVDDLTNEFLEKLRKKVKKIDKDNLIVGEVWHDASLEKYVGHDIYPSKLINGKQLDTVTNYQFRDVIISYFKNRNAEDFINRIYNIIDKYPKQVVDILFNMLSSHDTARIISVLGKKQNIEEERGFLNYNYFLSETEKEESVKLFKVASAIQFTLPGVPCIYYGDEIGMEGYNDPYNRAPFEWDNINNEIHEWHVRLAAMRKKYSVFKDGMFRDNGSFGELLAYKRENGEYILNCYFNVGKNEKEINVKFDSKKMKTIFGKVGNKLVSNGILIYLEKKCYRNDFEMSV